MAHAICFLCTLLLFVCHFQYFCSGRDTIKIGDWISDSNDNDDNKIVSAGNIFQLGFFTPSGNISGRYVGIQYCNSLKVVVWVANREAPIPLNVSGSFGIDIISGNLEVSGNGFTSTYFSTNLTNSPKSQAYLRTTKLYDSGNLVLIDDQTSSIVWESFNHPTDTFLLGMKMDENLNLTSWTSDKDPAPGSYSFRPDGVYEKYRLKPYWKIEGESANSFISRETNIVSAVMLYLSGTTARSINTSKGVLYCNNTSKGISYCNDTSRSKLFDSHSMLLMRHDGKIQYIRWDLRFMTRSVVSAEPQGPCSVYNACGTFSRCKPDSENRCNCLPAYEPANEVDWKSGKFSGGCRKKSSKCNRENTTSFETIVVKTLRSNTPIRINSSEDNCTLVCQNNCTCQAYSYRSELASFDKHLGSIGCWLWYDNLIEIQEGTDGDHIIHCRNDPPSNSDLGLSPLPIGNGHRKMKFSTLRGVIIATSVIFAVALICSITCIFYRKAVAAEKDRNIKENRAPRLYADECLMDQDDRFGEDDKKDIDVPFFELETILAATDNFSQAHKLGQGGFGPVYKGKFPGGEEIAVKRLSSNSGQGLMEFKNEVVLIAKLQHRNLVRLLGYCIKGNERILLYEYMPNKSLDAFIFDKELRMVLNWATRFDIIVGVARGLLYLHQDSRLRIIHRDMKASNILLDEEMNPKISDFGLARIVGRRETESNTTRVMGTYGYMAPEYALEGQFSVKSDAFSFGVVVLEIISGKKITSFFDSQLAMTLLGYAWNLWKAEKPMTLLDETLVGSCNYSEVLKCINVGLLCVQEDPNDRPDMSKVVFMLSGEIETLPNPKQPAFVTRKRFYGSTSSSSTKPETQSKNEITFTEVDGR